MPPPPHLHIDTIFAGLDHRYLSAAAQWAELVTWNINVQRGDL